MVSFQTLRDSQPQKLGRAVDAWGQLAKDLRKLEADVVSDLTRPLRTSGWRGGGADAAFRITDRLDDEFELAARQIDHATAVIQHARKGFVEEQENLQRVLTAAARLQMTVDAEGRVYPPAPTAEDYRTTEAHQRYQQIVQAAQQYSDDIRKILDRATALDEQCSKVLERFQPDVRGQMALGEWRDASADAHEALRLMDLSSQNLPREGATAAEVKAWWEKLSAEQRSLFITAYPVSIGELNGIPTADRHTANMINLRGLVLDQTALAERPPAPGPDGQAEAAFQQRRLQTLTGLLDRIEASEYGPEGRRLHLMGVDNLGDGRAIVAVGNPDTARTIGVVVPGIWTTIDGMEYQISRAEAIHGVADAFTTDSPTDVSVVAWLGYDTPSGVTEPPGGAQARQGAPLLDNFVDGIRATQSEGARVVAIGHSYGATVIGTAASTGNGLAVDGIIVAGAPGMRVPDGSHLIGLTRDQIWAGASYNDVVTFLGPVAHDTAPHNNVVFGSQRYYVDTSGHTDYWAPNSVSLQNQALILMGMTGDPRFRRDEAPFPGVSP